MRGGWLMVGATLSMGCAHNVTCDLGPSHDGAPPESLAASGLFCDDRVVEYVPAFRLWSDGSEKRRFILLPEDDVIDTSDENHWSFPVGTRVWKELADDSGVTETRFAERWGAGESDWTYASYQPDGTPGSGARCRACHASVPERVLGFSAVQLATDAGRAVAAELAAHFDTPPGLADQLTADREARNAIGMLHANCGHCHHDGPTAVRSSMSLRLSVAERTVEETAVSRTAVDVATDRFTDIPVRIVPGNAAESAEFHRLAARGIPAQMPPLETDRIDHPTAIAVGTWITGLKSRSR